MKRVTEKFCTCCNFQINFNRLHFNTITTNHILINHEQVTRGIKTLCRRKSLLTSDPKLTLWRQIQGVSSLSSSLRQRHEHVSTKEDYPESGGNTTATGENPLRTKDDEINKFQWAEKIIYSTYLQQFQPHSGFRRRLRERVKNQRDEGVHRVTNTLACPPLSWKYQQETESGSEQIIFKNEKNDRSILHPNVDPLDDRPVHFPFQTVTKTEFITNDLKHDADVENSQKGASRSTDKYLSETQKLAKLGKTLEDVLQSDGSRMEDTSPQIDYEDYGTPNRKIPSSSIPCGGCGALLHCQDPSIPGYMPSERFKTFKGKSLRTELCTRCHCLKNYNTVLNVNVSRKDYPSILKKIGKDKSMIVLLVDLTDFPCSIWPGIIDIIGTKRPVFLVGNKVDLLPQDSDKYLQHIRSCLLSTAKEIGLHDAKIVHTTLVSATTGFGIEDLITSIYDKWGTKGDIYIMGCTNVGKSSLFNLLLQSDLCKVHVADQIHRATISQWPGTTLNLLKFPVMGAGSYHIAERKKRLSNEFVERLDELVKKKVLLQETKNKEHAILDGHVGRTFSRKDVDESAIEPIITSDIFLHHKLIPKPSPRMGEWDPNDHNLQGKWCFDTPGTVNENQILDILTLPELVKTLPKSLIDPSTYFIRIGMTMFLGGLARIDFIDGFKPIRFTVFASKSIPITMLETKDADNFYQKALGSPILGVPEGNMERLSAFPELKPITYSINGEGHDYSCGDIVLSSIGWVAVTAGHDHNCTIRVHTPGGRGIYLRQPALLPKSVNQKGPRIRGTPAYLPHSLYIPTITQRPKF